MSHPAADRIVDLYREGAEDWIAARSTLGQGDLNDAGWLERFAAALPAGGSVLDVGCGHGHPIAASLLARGFRVTGLDTSERLIAHARRTLPNGEWIIGDMRTLEIDRHFDGIIAWCSLFHLTLPDQRLTLPRLLRCGAPGAVVLFNAGGAEGEAIGRWRGEALYHASLSPGDYCGLLDDAGYVIVAPDPDTRVAANTGVWLARRAFVSAE
ncbi:class I SAM-dependent methyltransferase [Brevundimonas variabilis]|uniref:SAM-dependent methyltransferase n=1 Tax=Brevundimonas variabilis TaxID=74312 RepID=A0A7W9CK78_9CAUL|nr:class I SAM-dependent methyltransferase [Brevundimonas variabilis]MBB5747157.1 SAM-dependent methyltransferase [Brevundimonas variabilis]